ncbi:MAG: tRNA (adenosine(37)-N6)-threonylcarbamoyltransferase complex dimerization subunit type 1 TsaB, partial [Sphingomonadaceae bacterium]
TLAIATGHALSLALLDGEQVLAEDHRHMDRGHAEALIPALRALLEGRPTPEAILVETGPGSFTGLRVGIAAARALALGWKVPVSGVSSMQLVAAEARARGHHGPLMVALAAPRGQVWIQRLAGVQPLGPPQSLVPEQARVALAASSEPVTGSAAATLEAAGPEREPRARFATRVPPPQRSLPLPLYVRPQAEAA